FGVFLVTLAGGELGGILGAFLAIPVGAAMSVILKDVIDERRNKALAVAAPGTRLELARVGGHKAEPKAEGADRGGDPKLIVAEPEA
ncbi:MAG: hypothetical protein QOD01_1087, partial [Actinomycetota bacterium]|nr:hypothetical protein [Actinomycetota bacterium]